MDILTKTTDVNTALGWSLGSQNFLFTFYFFTFYFFYSLFLFTSLFIRFALLIGSAIVEPGRNIQILEKKESDHNAHPFRFPSSGFWQSGMSYHTAVRGQGPGCAGSRKTDRGSAVRRRFVRQRKFLNAVPHACRRRK